MRDTEGGSALGSVSRILTPVSRILDLTPE